MNEREKQYSWWHWVHRITNHCVHRAETVRCHIMEFGLGSFPDMDRRYPRYSVIGGADYFG